MKYTLCEIEVKYTQLIKDIKKPKVNNCISAMCVLRNFIDEKQHQLDYKEYFYSIHLTDNLNVKGISIESIGGKNSTIVDINQIIAKVLKANTSSIILAHNHPSGNLQPSESDVHSFKKALERCKLFEINIADIIIFNGEELYSYLSKETTNYINDYESGNY